MIFLLAIFERAAGLTSKMRERDNATRFEGQGPSDAAAGVTAGVAARRRAAFSASSSAIRFRSEVGGLTEDGGDVAIARLRRMYSR